jgi:hypothetical protein
MSSSLDTWKAALNKVRRDGISINVLMTMRCNMECDHCMYASGPKRSAEYVSRDTLLKLMDFAEQAQAQDISVNFNLVGGEPTIDLDQFIPLAEKLNDRFVGMVEMTTNGWWLFNVESLRRMNRMFAQTGWFDNSQYVRISNSQWHTKFRNKHDQAVLASQVALQSYLDAPWDDFYPEVQCPACGEAKLSPVETCDRFQGDYKCGACGEDVNERTYYEQQSDAYDKMDLDVSTLKEAADCSQIYIDHHHGGFGKVSPVGRARTLPDATQDGHCGHTSGVKFTFKPNGELYDVCCNGGKVPLGHVDDGFLRLFALRHKFLDSLIKAYPLPSEKTHWPVYDEQTGERCYNCVSHGANWVKKNLAKTIPKANEFASKLAK